MGRGTLVFFFGWWVSDFGAFGFCPASLAEVEGSKNDHMDLFKINKMGTRLIIT